MKKNLLSLVLLFAFGLSFSQSKKDVLLTVDGNPVYVSEFKRVYNKNLELVKDESQRSVDGYLDLFIDYKLKIAAAYDQKMDESLSYNAEFLKYKNQLSRNYLYEDQVSKDLISEAYTRSLEEINANHLLIKVSYDDSASDTLKAYNRIKGLYERAKAGEDFVALVKKYSEEPNANKTGGLLDYFTAFSMVYPFETGAYNTKVGEISDIVRTQFGYHIIKVNDRRKRSGLINVSHIMIGDNGSDRGFDPEERVNEIKKLLAQGESFESLAKQYSDDKNSGNKGGRLVEFRRGDLRAVEFENAAFNLKNVGDISEPIKTDFGWHLIRLDKKPVIATFEQQRDGLKERIKNGDRSKIVSTALSSRIKEKYGFEKKNDYMTFYNTYIGETLLEKMWTFDSLPEVENKVLFTVGEREVKYNSFGQYVYSQKRRHTMFKSATKLITTMYDEFETSKLKRYFIDHLEEESPEYAATIDEYRSGLLIFDVMNENIWKKAKEDSVGLQEFYLKVQNNYIRKDGFEGIIVSSSNEDVAKQAQEILKDEVTSVKVKELLNKDNIVNALVSDGTYEKEQRELPEDLELKIGVSKIYMLNDRFVVVKINDLLPAKIKELDEVKGRVMSEYQNYLEKEWMDGLRKKYSVEVNKKALKKVKKALK